MSLPSPSPSGCNASAAAFSPAASGSTADADNAGQTVLAIICVCISSMSTTFGLFSQKISQDRGGICGRKDDSPRDKKISFLYWFGGFALITLVSFVLDLYSMAQLGQSLVVPLLAGLEVAENQVFAPMVLGAPLNKKYDYSAACIVVLGSLLTSLFGPKQGAAAGEVSALAPAGDCGEAAVARAGAVSAAELYSDNKLYFEGLFGDPLFIAYETIVCAVFVFCVVVARLEPSWAAQNLFLIYSYIAGFLGGQQNLFLKGVGTMFGLAFSGPEMGAEVFSDWIVWVFMLFMLVLAPAQLAVINVGLLKFSVLRFVPAYTVLYIIHGTSVGLFFYAEYKQLVGAGTIAGFTIGFLLIMASLYILALKPEPVDDKDENERSSAADSSEKQQHQFANIKIGVDTNPLTYILFAGARHIMLAQRTHRDFGMLGLMVGVPGRSAVRKVHLRIKVARSFRDGMGEMMTEGPDVEEGSSEVAGEREMEEGAQLVGADRNNSSSTGSGSGGVVEKDRGGAQVRQPTKVSPQASPVGHNQNVGFESASF